VTGIDVVCQTGDFRGWIFTIKDADGSGDCALNLDGERTSGGTCRHRDKTVCLEVSCKTGCIGGTGGCTCSVKKEGNNSVKTED
jgi:hypothetical protein